MVDNFEARQVRAAPGAAGAAAAAAGAGLLPEEDEDDSALSKFSKDIVQMARDGKLDPVVGRDEEISRVVSSPSLSFPLSLSLSSSWWRTAAWSVLRVSPSLFLSHTTYVRLTSASYLCNLI